MDNERAKNGLWLGPGWGDGCKEYANEKHTRPNLHRTIGETISFEYRRPEGRLHSNRAEDRYERVNVANGGHCTCFGERKPRSGRQKCISRRSGQIQLFTSISPERNRYRREAEKIESSLQSGTANPQDHIRLPRPRCENYLIFPAVLLFQVVLKKI